MVYTVKVAAIILMSVACIFPQNTNADVLRWDWPSGSQVKVLRGFDPPELRWLSGHRGVDLDCPAGSLIYAPADGVVIYASDIAGRPVVSVSHGQIRSTYEPATPLVNVGDTVQRGQAIATVVAGHEPSGLHWGAKTGRDDYVNPLRMLIGPVVLKPWE